MIDRETFERIVSCIENDPEIIRLIVEGTRFTGDLPIFPDDLGYSPEIAFAHQRADAITKAAFTSDDAWDYARIFIEARKRITAKHVLKS